MKKTHDYIHYYRGYWSEGGKCRIRIYKEDGRGNERIVPQRFAEELISRSTTPLLHPSWHLNPRRLEFPKALDQLF